MLENYYYSFIEFILKNNLLKKDEKKIINDFLKKVNEKLTNFDEKNVLALFPKERFLELYTNFFLNSDPVKYLFKEINYIDLDKFNIDNNLDKLVKYNKNLNPYQLKKLNTFIIKKDSNNSYIVSAYILDKSDYIDIKEKIGEYKLLVSHPPKVKEIVEKIYNKLEYAGISEFLDKLEKENKKSVLDDIKEENINLNQIQTKKITLDLKISSYDIITTSSLSIKKLSDKLKKNKFSILASPFNSDLKLINIFIKNGINIIKFHINITHPVSNYKFKSWDKEKENLINLILENPNITFGLVPGDIKENIEEINYFELESYIDFIDIFINSFTTYYLNIPKNVERVVAINRVLNKEELEILDRLKISAIEASIIDKSQYGLPLTLDDILNYSKLANNSSIPVLIPTQKHIKPKDVKILYEIGAKGLVLGGISLSLDYKELKKNLYEFINEISKL
jgi:galactitol-specific phosphotransferase system IIB component